MKKIKTDPNKIYEKILKDIKPNSEEVKSITASANTLMSRLKNIVDKNVELRVAGSIARGTNLKGNADIDIFMLFSNKINRHTLEKMGLEYGKRLANKKYGERYEIKYAEHPYVRVYLKTGLRADIVPAFKIENIEDLATAVDRTPLHTDFINTHLNAKQRDEVRLLKYLLKSHFIYGAESKTSGFSGYLCEILIHHFGSITELLNWFSTVKLPVTLYPKTKEIEYKCEKRFGSNFVVIDPVDPNRNVAAAVSIEALARLVLISRIFIEHPSTSIFYGKGFSSLESKSLLNKFLKDTKLDMFIITVNLADKSADVTWPQLRKLSTIISDNVKKYGFETYLSFPVIHHDKGLVVILSNKSILGTRLFKGPEIFETKSTSDFITKHSKSFGFVMKGGTIYTLDRNKYASVKDALSDMIKNKKIHGRKDASLNKSVVISGRVPARYAFSIYAELVKQLGI